MHIQFLLPTHAIIHINYLFICLSFFLLPIHIQSHFLSHSLSLTYNPIFKHSFFLSLSLSLLNIHTCTISLLLPFFLYLSICCYLSRVQLDRKTQKCHHRKSQMHFFLMLRNFTAYFGSFGQRIENCVTFLLVEELIALHRLTSCKKLLLAR